MSEWIVLWALLVGLTVFVLWLGYRADRHLVSLDVEVGSLRSQINALRDHVEGLRGQVDGLRAQVGALSMALVNRHGSPEYTREAER